MSSPDLKSQLRRNIDTLGDKRARDRADAGLGDRLAAAITGFTGSMTFVAIHAALFGGWIFWNLWLEPKFDPSFVVLAMVASVEAIFLSTFVLISQNRTARLADERADLDLHINLLAEHELSRVAALLGRIADRLEVPTDGANLDEIARNVRPEQVLDTLRDKEPPPTG
ncbi:DUF1003 domain-containing protein [Sphingomonas sp. KR1UV-12]|uniref:DUF1003 domain-containing protein n=1 Tax=Sphingomonas aurea TaxID=3063994 RepID=A0ABT9EHM8_9SPHN|nr:DUF1003 domain-containing protein [Sphingomonas sp. KR1UV-12]MDP1026469.1 DUF1003 domain-containing protein [Sphingomonas sp. KR1UV-12]